MHPGLLADILEHPEDDVPRLILADWLDEHGQEERADLIRTQILVGENYFGQPCWPTRISHCRPLWEAPFRAMGTIAMMWRRGFVNEVTLPCAAWLVHGPELVCCQPIQRVTFSDKKPADVFISDEVGSQWRWWHWPMPGDEYIRELEDPDDLPTVLYERLPSYPNQDEEEAYYDTEQEALRELSVACLAWARKEVRVGR